MDRFPLPVAQIWPWLIASALLALLALLVALLLRRGGWPLLLICVTVQAPDPHLQAQWDSATSATVSWTQQARGCLSVVHATGETAFIGCYERPASYVIGLGHAGPLDGTARPASGDVYMLQASGQIWRAPLVGRPQYLAVLRR